MYKYERVTPSKKIDLKLQSIFVCMVFVIGLFLTNIAEASVYLEYNTAKTDGGTTGILNIYQPVLNAPNLASTKNRKYVKHKFYQYSGGSWDNAGNTLGNIASVSTYTYATTSADWTWNNGTGGATWTSDLPVTGYGFKKFIAPASGYTDYSAYGQITLSQNADNLLMGFWYNPTINGVIRIKVNGVVQSNVGDLDVNGEYDLSVSGANLDSPATGNVYFISIGKNVLSGDIVTVEAKTYNGTKSRIYIYGIKYANYNAVPGSTNWQFIDRYLFEVDNITSTVVSKFAPVGDSGSFNDYCLGPAHAGHENNGSTTAITLDGTAYTLGTDLNVGNVISGNSLTIVEGNNVYGTASPADDFADITRTFVWTDSNLSRTWNIVFKKQGANSTFFYIVTAYPSNTAGIGTRYWGLDNDTYLLMPTSGLKTGLDVVTPLENSSTISIFGGDVGVKLQISSENSGYAFQAGGSTNKLYLRKESWEKLWNTGENVSNTNTLVYSYEPPENINWSGKTLIIAKSDTISNATSSLPFLGSGVYAKLYTGIGLTFSNIAPIRTFFTSLKDPNIGSTIRYAVNTPAKGNWSGITVSGVVNALDNIINYSTTGLTLTSNSNAYNNTLYSNTTGINAASGSTASNNILNTNTTNTTGAGSFDYNLYVGNVESNGKNENIYFPQLNSRNFSIVATSTAIDFGISSVLTSTTTDYLGNPIYGTPDIGAYEYQPPFTIGTSLVDPTGNIRIYGDGKYRYTTATSSTMSANLSVTPAETWSYEASTTRPEWLNISNITWGTTKQWIASSTTATTTIYTVGDLTPSTVYIVTVDGATTTAIASTSCSYGNCTSGSDGKLRLTYTGGYSSHTFALTLDTTNPTISITTPSTESTISGTVTLTANTTDNAGISGVTFYQNSTIIGSEITSTSSPNTYTTTWDTTQVSDGSYTIQAVARDFSNNYATSTITATVLNTVPATPTSQTSSGSSAQSRIANLISMGLYNQAEQIAKRYNIPLPSNIPAKTTFTRTLRQGMTGNDIKALQQFLNSKGFTVSKTGPGSLNNETNYFGPATKSAIMRFQLFYKKEILEPQGLTAPTGIFGEGTRRVVNGM